MCSVKPRSFVTKLVVVELKLFTFPAPVYRCDTANGWLPWKDHCYYYSPKNVEKNWHDARVACVDMDADLASIVSPGENDFVESVIWQNGNYACPLVCDKRSA